MKCPNCKGEIPNHANFCPLCGSLITAKISSIPLTKPEKKTTKAKQKFLILPIVLICMIATVSIFLPKLKEILLPYWESYQYEQIISLISTKDYDSAVEILNKLNSDNQQSNYLHAKILFETGEYKKSTDLFCVLGDYKDSAELCQEARYQYTQALIEEKNYRAALTQLKLLGDYKDSSTLYDNTKLESEYSIAMVFIENNDYKTAIIALETIIDYKDSADQIAKCNYLLGIESMEKQAWDDAITYFTAAGDYEDSTERKFEAQEKKAQEITVEAEKKAQVQAAVAAQEEQKLEKLKEQVRNGLSIQFNIKDSFKKSGIFQVHSITAKLSNDGSKYVFTVDCTLPQSTKTSFFNPPDGTVFMLTNVKGKSGRNTYTYTISREKVKSVDSITVMFSNGDNDRGHAHFKTAQLY